MAGNLTVTVWPAVAPGEDETFDGFSPIEITNVDFISFVTDETFGKPPVIPDGSGNNTVVYINAKNISAAKVTR